MLVPILNYNFANGKQAIMRPMSLDERESERKTGAVPAAVIPVLTTVCPYNATASYAKREGRADRGKPEYLPFIRVRKSMPLPGFEAALKASTFVGI